MVQKRFPSELRSYFGYEAEKVPKRRKYNLKDAENDLPIIDKKKEESKRDINIEGEHIATEIADNNLSDKDENDEREDRIVLNNRHTPINMHADRNQMIAWRVDREDRYVHSDVEENKVEVLNISRQSRGNITYNNGNDLIDNPVIGRNSSQFMIRRSGTEYAQASREEIKNEEDEENRYPHGNIYAEDMSAFRVISHQLQGSRNVDNSLNVYNEIDRLIDNQDEGIEANFRANFAFQTLSDSNFRRNNSTVE